LANTEEYQGGKSNGALGEVFIRYVIQDSSRAISDVANCRCNNVLYIISRFSSQLPISDPMFTEKISQRKMKPWKHRKVQQCTISCATSVNVWSTISLNATRLYLRKLVIQVGINKSILYSAHCDVRRSQGKAVVGTLPEHGLLRVPPLLPNSTYKIIMLHVRNGL
jgi:hypothetical protein